MVNYFSMQTARKIFTILKNKYLVALVLFATIMLFTDHNNFFEQRDRQRQLKELQTKKQYYQQEIEKTQKELADLSNNPAAIEKYAREHFMMKRDNEDVFVVPDSSLKK
jgi:cell division protein DivIC